MFRENLMKCLKKSIPIIPKTEWSHWSKVNDDQIKPESSTILDNDWASSSVLFLTKVLSKLKRAYN
jgi:hypothetical protein